MIPINNRECVTLTSRANRGGMLYFEGGGKFEAEEEEKLKPRPNDCLDLLVDNPVEVFKFSP